MGLGPPSCPICKQICNYHENAKICRTRWKSKEDPRNKNGFVILSHYYCDIHGIEGSYDHLYSSTSDRTSNNSTPMSLTLHRIHNKV